MFLEAVRMVSSKQPLILHFLINKIMSYVSLKQRNLQISIGPFVS